MRSRMQMLKQTIKHCIHPPRRSLLLQIRRRRISSTPQCLSRFKHFYEEDWGDDGFVKHRASAYPGSIRLQLPNKKPPNNDSNDDGSNGTSRLPTFNQIHNKMVVIDNTLNEVERILSGQRIDAFLRIRQNILLCTFEKLFRRGFSKGLPRVRRSFYENTFIKNMYTHVLEDLLSIAEDSKNNNRARDSSSSSSRKLDQWSIIKIWKSLRHNFKRTTNFIDQRPGNFRSYTTRTLGPAEPRDHITVSDAFWSLDYFRSLEEADADGYSVSERAGVLQLRKKQVKKLPKTVYETSLEYEYLVQYTTGCERVPVDCDPILDREVMTLIGAAR